MDEPVLSFESPESSNIQNGSYDPDSQQLTITFRGGRTYDYPGVPPSLWEELEQAESRGHCFSTRIKPFYVGRKR